MESKAFIFSMFDFTLIQSIFILLIVFQVKHLFGDYLLQTSWMVIGKYKRKGWLKPLSTHAFIHAMLTLIITLAIDPKLAWLALLDFTVHFVIDRIKAHPRLGGRFKIEEGSPFWWAFGTDQMMHHLTHYFIIYMIIQDLFFK